MKYRVIRNFADIQDGYHVYNVGDDFPRIGTTVSESRIQQLITGNNMSGTPAIEAVEDGNMKSEAVEVVEERPKRGRKPKN